MVRWQWIRVHRLRPLPCLAHATALSWQRRSRPTNPAAQSLRPRVPGLKFSRDPNGGVSHPPLPLRCGGVSPFWTDIFSTPIMAAAGCSAATALGMEVEVAHEALPSRVIDPLSLEAHAQPRQRKQRNAARFARLPGNRHRATLDFNARAALVPIDLAPTARTWQPALQLRSGTTHLALERERVASLHGASAAGDGRPDRQHIAIARHQAQALLGWHVHAVDKYQVD